MENNIKNPTISVPDIPGQEIDLSITNTKKLIYIFISLFTAVLYDRFFANGEPGISVFIFALCFAAAFYIINKENICISTAGILCTASLFIIALNYGIYTNPLMQALDFLAIPILCTAAFLLFSNKSISWEKLKFLGEILIRIFISPILYIAKPFIFIKTLITKSSFKTDAKKRSIYIGILVSLILLAVIIPLLSSADMVFGYFMSNITDIFKINNSTEIFFHTILILIAFIYIFGYMVSFKYQPKVLAGQNCSSSKWLNPVTAVTSLVPLTIVYLLFSIIQFSYLYGSSSAALPDGFTYAEYARRGFFELVAVTVINFTIIIFITHFSAAKTATQKKLLNILLTLMTVFTFNMLFSANFKLSLYENAYGFTYLRFFVHGFIIMIFILMILVLLGIWIKKVNIIKCCLIASIAFFTMLNLISPDKIIASANIQRFKECGKIDIGYLSQLSSDSIPQLVEFSKTDTQKTSEVRELLLKKKANLKNTKWYEFNLSRNSACNALKNLTY